MNKLEEIKNKLWEVVSDTSGKVRADGFAEGFQEAINLELPVKFGEWIYKAKNPTYKEYVRSFVVQSGTEPSVVHLYKYWIEHIYKPE